MAYEGEVRRDGINYGDSYLNAERKGIQMMGADEYLECLTNPLHLSNAARIPDLNGHPVSVYTDTLESTIGIQAATGGAGVHGFTMFFENGAMYLVLEGTASTDTACTYDASSIIQPSTSTASTVATYENARLVGAGFQVEYLGNDSTNSGLITMAYLSKPDLNGNVNAIPVSTQTLLQNQRQNWAGPLKHGARAHYVPLDPDDFTFQTPLVNNPTAWNSAVTSKNLRAAIQVHFIANQQCNIRITAVAHYEGLAISDAAAAGPQIHSLYDPIGLASVLNIAQTRNALGTLSGPKGTGLAYQSSSTTRKRKMVPQYLQRPMGIKKKAYFKSGAI